MFIKYFFNSKISLLYLIFRIFSKLCYWLARNSRGLNETPPPIPPPHLIQVHPLVCIVFTSRLTGYKTKVCEIYFPETNLELVRKVHTNVRKNFFYRHVDLSKKFSNRTKKSFNYLYYKKKQIREQIHTYIHTIHIHI